jgi:general secretion pathway protein G
MVTQARKHSRRQRGYSLMELAVVIAIISLLSGLVLTMNFRMEQLRFTQSMWNESALVKATIRMRMDVGMGAAACLGDLAHLTSASIPAACRISSGIPGPCQAARPGDICWDGPYVATVPADPWGNAYRVTVDSTTGVVSVRSSGPDGIPGNADDTSVQQ